jgi:hypothetical protein
MIAGPRRSLLLLPLIAAASGLALGSVGVAAASCDGDYVAQLLQVRVGLEAGTSIQGAVARLQALGSADHASSALAPAIADLEGGDVSGAERLLATTAATLQAASGSGCAGLTAHDRQSLARVYGSPAFANLDQPSSPNWLQQLISALGNALGGVLGTLGPLGAGILAALLLGIVAAIAVWRIRQVTASGRETRAAPPAAPPEVDAEREWSRALAASEGGDFRTAIRHAFRSALVSLVQRGRLPVQPAWTTPELLARARGDPELTAQLTPAAAGFDRAWYSEAPVDAERWEEVRGHCQAIRGLAGRRQPPS